MMAECRAAQRTVLWSAAFAATMATVPDARAQAASIPLRVDYQAPAECPDEAAFMAELSERTPLARRASADEAAVGLEIRIASTPDRTVGQIVIRELDGSEARRRIPARDCANVVSALAFIAAVTIDPNALVTKQPERRPPPPPPPPPPLPPVRQPPPPPEARYRVAFGVDASGALALTPAPLVGPRPYLELRRMGVSHWSAALRASASWQVTAASAENIGRADLAWWTGRLDACVDRWLVHQRWSLGPCIAFEAGAVDAAGLDIAQPRSDVRRWLAVDALARTETRVFGWLLLHAEVGATVPLTRYRFYFEPNATIHEIPPLAAIGGIGVGVALP